MFEEASNSTSGLTDSQLRVLIHLSLSTAALSVLGSLSILLSLLLCGKNSYNGYTILNNADPVFNSPPSSTSSRNRGYRPVIEAEQRRSAVTFESFVGDKAMIVQLSIADLLASVGLIVGGALYLADRSLDPDACLIIGGWNTAFYICTFLFTFLYALRLYMTTMSWTGLWHQRFFRLACVISWTLPIILVIVFVTLHAYGNNTADDSGSSWCYNIVHSSIEKEYTVYSTLLFEIPLLLVLVGNTILFILTARQIRWNYRRTGEYTNVEQEKEKRVIRKLSFFMGIFLFCWTPLVIICIWYAVDPSAETSSLYPVFIIEAITVPLQGFLNSIVYGWLSTSFKQIRETVGHRLRPEKSVLTTPSRYGSIENHEASGLLVSNTPLSARSTAAPARSFL